MRYANILDMSIENSNNLQAIMAEPSGKPESIENIKINYVDFCQKNGLNETLEQIFSIYGRDNVEANNFFDGLLEDIIKMGNNVSDILLTLKEKEPKDFSDSVVEQAYYIFIKHPFDYKDGKYGADNFKESVNSPEQLLVYIRSVFRDQVSNLLKPKANRDYVIHHIPQSRPDFGKNRYRAQVLI
jgi:hypothetical protein